MNKAGRATPRQKGAAAAAAAFLLLAAGSFADTSRAAGEVDAKGLSERIAQEKGHVVLVNFWATWCVPCREEFPELARLNKAYGGQGLRVLGVSILSEPAAVDKFLAEHKPGFPSYRKKSGGDDQQFIDAVDKSWGGELPFTVLYGRDGKKAKGLSGKHSFREYEAEILKLLR